ncbi:MAG: sugar phosphate isomerase/epimerase [Bacteroidetes bacterium]|nr:sugar phosphate isomerase/epimerase [Bacteroidota bacterium]
MYNERIVCAYLYPITKYGYPPDADRTVDYLREMKALGFKNVELEGIRESHLQKVYDLKDNIAENIISLDLNVSYFCTVLPGLSLPDKNTKQQQLDLFVKGCEIAKLFGAKGVLDNAPLPPYKFPADIPVVRHYNDEIMSSAYLPFDLNWDEYWDNLINTYRTICDIAKDYGLTYQVHPALGLLSSTTDSFLYFYDAVKRDNLRFNLDTANQFILNDNLTLALRRLKDHIDYIHISDNRGKKPEHLEIGKGIIRWDIFFETIDLINYKGLIGLDIGGSESSIDNLDIAYKNSADWLEKNWLGKK